MELTKSDGTSTAAAQLTPKQLKFFALYVELGNATEAYRRAYDCSRMKETTIARAAHELTKNPKIAAMLANVKQSVTDNAQYGLREIFEAQRQIATADVTELMTYRRLNCRHCWGVGFAYQWLDEAEYERDLAAWEGRQAKAKPGTYDPQPSDLGGYGFVFNERPHPKCPACHGEGHADVFFKDTRDLSDGARMLFNGVKVTKEGIQVLTLDRSAAYDKMIRMLGGYKDTLVVHPGASVENAAKDLPLDAQEASRLYAERMKSK